MSVLGLLSKEASSQSKLADAMLARSKHRLDSILRLFEQGHASFKDVTDAKMELSSLHAQQFAALEMVQFIDAMKVASDQSGPQASESSSRRHLLLMMDSLASDPRTRLISTLNLDLENTALSDAALTEHLDQIQKMNAQCNQLRSRKNQAREDAWAELLYRLDNINDGSLSIQNEILLTQFEQRVAIARKEATEHQITSIAINRTANVFQLDDRLLSTDGEILAEAAAEAARIQTVAIAQSSQNQKVLLTELSSRLHKAASMNACPPNEINAIEQRIAHLELRHGLAVDLVSDIKAASQSNLASDDVGPTYRYVSKMSDEPVFPLDTTRRAIQLQDAHDATIDRLLSAADQAEACEYRRDRLVDKSIRIQNLSEQDPFFDREAEVSRLRAELARAEAKHAKFEHELRILENRFADAVLLAHQAIALGGTDDRLSWSKPLKQWFKLKSESNTSHDVARQQLELDRWLLSGTERLHQTGDASWKELTAARVRCAESHYDILQSETRQKMDLMIYQILEQSVDLPISLPATAG